MFIIANWIKLKAKICSELCSVFFWIYLITFLTLMQMTHDYCRCVNHCKSLPISSTFHGIILFLFYTFLPLIQMTHDYHRSVNHCKSLLISSTFLIILFIIFSTALSLIQMTSAYLWNVNDNKSLLNFSIFLGIIFNYFYLLSMNEAGDTWVWMGVNLFTSAAPSPVEFYHILLVPYPHKMETEWK